MCGISTILRKAPPSLNFKTVEQFNNLVQHRGPDASDISLFKPGQAQSITPDQDWTLALGHRRLSIIDLSDAGKQPMCFGKDYWIVFNGEIYNYVELKEQLKQQGHQFQNKSDTEVILAAYAEWGTNCFEQLRGMWSIVLYDAKEDRLVISRDRMGIKPVYFYEDASVFAIASEIKQFTALPQFKPKITPNVVKEFIQTGFESDQHSFFDQIQPLHPGTFCIYDLKEQKRSSFYSYWNPGHIQPDITDKEEAGHLFRSVFFESVNIHLRSDVPVGCQLSGGLDSSSVLSSMSQILNGATNIHTFTAIFPGFKLNEAPFVKEAIKGIQVQDHYTTPAPEQFLEQFDRFIYHHDEPVGSFSMYAGYEVARLINEHNIKVVLNGQGGDEILGGYWQMYFTHLLNGTKANPLLPIRHFMGALSWSGNEDLILQAPRLLKRYFSKKNANPIPFKSPNFKDDSNTSLGYLEQYLQFNLTEKRLFDIRKLILPRLLKWDDRNLMAFSIEGRYPLLDHVLIEACLRFHPETLYHKGWTKYPIRKGMDQLLPQSILYRKSKWGFETPQQHWLEQSFKKQLDEWVLNSNPVFEIIEQKAVSNLLEKIRRSKDKEQNQLFFRIFILDKWLQRFNVSIN